MLAEAARGQVRNRDSKMLAEILGGCIDAQAVNASPQVELGSGGVAAEAAVTVSPMKAAVTFQRSPFLTVPRLPMMVGTLAALSW